MNIEPEDIIFPLVGGYVGLIIILFLFIEFKTSLTLNFYGGILLLCMLIGAIIRSIKIYSLNTGGTK